MNIRILLFMICCLMGSLVVNAEEVGGTTGPEDNLTWTFDSGVLTISGTGEMSSTYVNGNTPWVTFKDRIFTVIIEDGVTNIGAYPFSLFNNLTSVTIPNTVTSIDVYAFYYCGKLASITIPKSVDNIKAYAFGDCTGLKSIAVLNTTPPTVASNAFANIKTEDILVYIPVGSKDAYEDSEYWSAFSNFVEPNIENGLVDGITDYIVNSAKGLAKLATLVNESEDGLKDYTFTMTEDIDLTNLLEDKETYPKGWVAIGEFGKSYFSGTFNGGNFKISGLAFTGKDMGLFGIIGTDGTVKNLHIETAKEGINGGNNIAGLAYMNRGNIKQCGISGKITSIDNGGFGAAGLVFSNSGTITSCYSTADITVTLTGTSETQYAFIAGLVYGNFNGTIENCYATGAVTITGTHGSNTAGGLLNENMGTVINSYATGPLTAEGGMTGFIVKNYETTTNCYYNNEIKGYPEADDNATGLSEADMKKAASFVEEWDFEDTWAIDEGSSYPYLAWAGKMETETPGVDTYYTITLDVAAGIDLYNLSAGNLQVAEGDHLYLQFMPEDRTLGAADVLFLIDGVETEFSVLGENNYFSYILNPVSQDHTILIALREYPVTLPETEGVIYNVGAGTHLVPYGETFTFSLTLAEGIDPADVHLFANGIEIQPDALRSVVLTYTIDKVITPITVVVEGANPTSNGNIAKDDITLSIINCQLSIINSGSAVDVSVYTIAGQNVVLLRALRDSKTITLQPGIYLVKAGPEVYKVSVH